MNPRPTLAIACGLALATAAGTSSSPPTESQQRQAMQLGVFSISLAVKDIKASKTFCEKLDFRGWRHARPGDS